MQTKDVEVSVDSVSGLVFWHEEIFDLIRHKSPIGAVPQTNENFYKEVGFKPTFYSLHIATIDSKKNHLIAFTRIEKDCSTIHKIMGLVDNDNSSNLQEKESYRPIVGKIICAELESRIDHIVRKEDDFSLSHISMQLFALRQIRLEGWDETNH
ncbi:MAG: hypothetical protein AAGJ08_25110 [Cyanobacteria bacterium P01_H01_bin.35]